MSDSIKSADRRLKLLLMLQSSKQLSVNKIADYFGVSRRTVFRDLRALQDMEVPIMHDSVEGYSLVKGYKVPPLMFTERELSSIVLGLSFMKSQQDVSMKNDASQVLLKIKNAVPSKLLEFIQSVENNVIASPYFQINDPSETPNDWYLLLSAIAEHSRVQFDYSNQQGEKSVRTVDPYMIVLYQDHWNVIGFDYTRNDRRNFRLDSIKNIQLLPDRFQPISENESKKLIYGFDSTLLKSYRIQIKREKKESFFRVFPGLIEHVVEKESYLEIHFLFDNETFLAEFLIPHLNHIKIESNELKQEIKRILEKQIRLL